MFDLLAHENILLQANGYGVCSSHMSHPPTAYGSSTCLGMSTVIRSKNARTTKGDINVVVENIPYRKEDQKKTVNGNICWSLLEQMIENYINDRGVNLQKAFEEWEKDALQLQITDLAAGKQTYDWISRKNLKAKIALRDTLSVLEDNLGKTLPNNTLLMCNHLFELSSLPEVRIPNKFEWLETKDVYIKSGRGKHKFMKKVGTKQVERYLRVTRGKRDRKGRLTERFTILQKDLLQQWCTLNVMTKSKERGKEERRSIATASIPARAFISVTESLADVLCKIDINSAYPKGPQEKMNMIMNYFGSAGVGTKTIELTGDNSKWNECISMRAIMMIYRQIHKKYGKIDNLRAIFDMVDYIFSNKRAMVGRGFPMKDKYGRTTYFNPIDILKETNLPFPRKDHESYAAGYDQDTNTVAAYSGMFMGMANGGSTMLAMIVANEIQRRYVNQIRIVQSSDDFVLFISSDNWQQILEEFICLSKSVGINISDKKSLIVSPGGISEFNQMLRLENFVPINYLEIPGIHLVGKNPITDLAMGLNTIANAGNKLTLTTIGITTAARILIKRYRRIFYCERDERQKRTKKSKIICEVFRKYDGKVLMYDGGPVRHSFTTLKFPEVVIGIARGDLDEEYLLSIFDTEQPFGTSQASSFEFDSVMKKMVMIDDKRESNIYAFEFARHRGILNEREETKPNKAMILEDRARKDANRIISNISGEYRIINTSNTIACSVPIINKLKRMIQNSTEDIEWKRQKRQELEDILADKNNLKELEIFPNPINIDHLFVTTEKEDPDVIPFDNDLFD